MKLRDFLNASKSIYRYQLDGEKPSFLIKNILLTKGIVEAISVQTPKIIECNLCGWRGARFLNFYSGFGYVYPNAICPQCVAHPRHRSYGHYFQKLFNSDKTLDVLHFAPEQEIEKTIRGYKNINYLSVDIDETKAMQKEDIRNLSFADNTFDVIVCVHVFEHIDDDKKAMQEVFRVLKPGGIALLDVPIEIYNETTLEDKSITSREARTKAYWQWDHVRLYGRDYPKKLNAVGFSVEEDFYVRQKGQDFIKKHGLDPSPSYLATKPKLVHR